MVEASDTNVSGTTLMVGSWYGFVVILALYFSKYFTSPYFDADSSHILIYKTGNTKNN